MTTGSNAGYPDVIQMPRAVKKHHPLCPYHPVAVTWGIGSMECQCYLIISVIQDERNRLRTAVNAMPTAPKSPYGAVFKKDVLDVIDDVAVSDV